MKYMSHDPDRANSISFLLLLLQTACKEVLGGGADVIVAKNQSVR